MKFKDASVAKPPTVVPPGAKIEDLVIPAKNVYFRKGWGINPFLFVRSGTSKDKIDMKPDDVITEEFIKNSQIEVDRREGIGDGLALKGKAFSLYLPMIVNGKPQKENINFEIKDVSCAKE